jgi:hypothetical protein
MLKQLFALTAFITSIVICSPAIAQKSVPDTVLTGVYITSIHDINFKDKEYTIDLWLWLKYKNRDFDFVQNLEVPQAKTVTNRFRPLILRVPRCTCS